MIWLIEVVVGKAAAPLFPPLPFQKMTLVAEPAEAQNLV